MAGTFPRIAGLATGDGDSSPPGPNRGRGHLPRRLLVRLGALAALVALVLAAAALIPGSHSSAPAFSVDRTTGGSGNSAPLKTRQSKVFGSSIPGNRYGTLDGLQENRGVNAQGQLTSDLAPLSPRDFDRPIAQFRVYAEQWSRQLARSLGPLKHDLRTGSRGAAKRDWATSFDDYLHLGATYSLLPDGLQQHLAEIPPSLGETDFPGIHRIERGLWTGQSPRSLVPVASALSHTVAQLQRTLPTVPISPLDYATRAHEILEDAQRDLMSGTQVPWSGAGVLGTAAGTAATREAIATLVPIMQGRDNTLVEVQNWLVLLQRSLNSVRRKNGSWPALGQLSQVQRDRLNGTLAGALGALSAVPGTLETQAVPQIPSISSQETKG